MSKYIRMTQTYLVLITVFVLSRFALEAVGPEYISWLEVELEFDSLVSEISLTRLFWVLPVFLGLRFVSESLGGWKEMIIANFTYVTWGFVLLSMLHFADDALALETHYGNGTWIGTSIGQVINWWGWGMHPGAPSAEPREFHFCASILSMGIVANIFCWITIKWNGRASSVEEKSG